MTSIACNWRPKARRSKPGSSKPSNSNSMKPARSSNWRGLRRDREYGIGDELLEVSNESELEQFLGNLVAQAGKSLGRFVGSPQGQALVGVLKGAARQVLPTLGSSVGGYLGGDEGAKLGGQAASAAGRAFGLELEGLSNEDREFEVARRYVDFAGEAVRKLAADGARNPTLAARAAAPPPH